MGRNDLFGLLIFCTAIVLPFLIYFLTKHQQKMAEIVHNSQRSQQSEQALQAEMKAMRDLLAQQTIMLDSLVRSQDKDVRQRLSA